MASNLFVSNPSPPSITITQIDWGSNPISCDSTCPSTPGSSSSFTVPYPGSLNLDIYATNGVLNGCITITDSIGVMQNQSVGNGFSGVINQHLLKPHQHHQRQLQHQLKHLPQHLLQHLRQQQLMYRNGIK